MRRGWLAALAAISLFVLPAQAQKPEPKAFVEAIYKTYLGKNTPGLDLSTRAALDLYFTASLADLIEKDAKEAEKLQEAPLLNGDPFVDGQDWEITDPVVTIQESAGDRATATATFKNFGKTVTVRLALVLTPNGWRVDDIFWSEGNLRGLYKPPQ
ncbi:MAG: DUF3828 domain-containing protein [Rhizobiales bacterium]|nr:DUF3828 domain-containing protein [Hyphomicrobiales bacterium]